MKRNILIVLPLISLVVLTTFFGACGGMRSTTNTNSSSSSPTSNTASTPTSTTSTTTTTPPTKAVNNIAGNYEATGTNAGGGGAYKAKLLITQRDAVYQFSWESGSKKYDGVGVLTDNSIGVSFADGADGKGCGVALYKIGMDGSLDGRSGYWGVNEAESEKAVRTSGTDLDGNYEISGKGTGGKDYQGTLEIKKDGEGYTFLWNTGSTLEGFGVKVKDKVAVGFGGKSCSFVYYDVEPDGTLDGKWGGAGSKSFGTEIAKKK